MFVCMNVEILVIITARYIKFGRQTAFYHMQSKFLSNTDYHAHSLQKMIIYNFVEHFLSYNLLLQ